MVLESQAGLILFAIGLGVGFAVSDSSDSNDSNNTLPDTTPNSAVLILNTQSFSFAPRILDASGFDDQSFYFNYGLDTDAYNSCGLTFRNQFYMYGGRTDRETERQISQIMSCELKRIRDLPFDFVLGACTSVANQKLILCFDENDSKQCYQATSPTGEFESIPQSNDYHLRTSVGASDGNFMI